MSESRLSDRECVGRCKSVEHGEIVCATLTKREPLDTQLCSYLQCLCCCCESVRDHLGRTALHVAASCGRPDVVKWLIGIKRANINAKDSESGYTPLHRSIFYGKINIAVYLIKQGANVALTDSNGFTSLEHAMEDILKPIDNNLNYGEVYVWGSNTNYTLGPQQARLMPELLDAYHKEYPNLYVQQICLDKFHCVLVSTDGKVFACGHGQGGRLGLSSEKTVITPKQLKFVANGHTNPVICKRAYIAINHSVFLMESGHVWTCGLNSHRVLGIKPPPEQLLIPCPLPLMQHEVQDVCAGKYHTVAWGQKVIYSWGMHGGQLGHNKNNQKYIEAPKVVGCLFGLNCNITAVAASDGATAVVTSKGDIYVLHEYQCRKIASRQLNIISISTVGGRLNEKLDDSLSLDQSHELTVIALNNVGNVYIWQESHPQFARCIYSINRSLKVRQIALNLNEVLLTTYSGETFKGIVKPRKRLITESNTNGQKSAFHKFLEKDTCQLLKVAKIPHIHRGIAIYSDLKGQNYAVLQTSPKTYVTKVPEISNSSIGNHMYIFLKEANENDGIHDVIFKVSNCFFPTHRYIIASNSDKLENLMLASADKTIELLNVDPNIFEQLLIFLYTGTCDLLRVGKCLEKLQPKKSENETENDKSKISLPTANVSDPIRLLQETSKRFGVKTLQKLLGNFYCDNGYILKKKKFDQVTYHRKFNRNIFPELHNVILKTKDKQEILAHKCILAARLDYFNNLFSTRWNEDTTSTDIYLPYPYSILNQLLEFLYTDELPFLDNEDIEHVCHLLILADQLFIYRLKEVCECTLSTFVSLKNVAQMLSFASVYNADQLKTFCMEFICLNLTALLESKSLELTDEDLLCDITNFYCKYNPVMQYRIITPYSNAPSDEVVITSNTCEILLEDSFIEDISNNNKSISKTLKKRSRNRKSSSTDYTNKKEEVDQSTSKHISSNETFEEVKPLKQDMANVNKVESRLKAIVTAQDKINCDNSVPEYVKLSSKSDFPELSACHSFSSHSKSPSKLEKVDVKQKISKISQKQRKRLSSIEVPEPQSPVQEEVVKNPWKINTELTNTCPTKERDALITINAIITDEKKQKENFAKMKMKLLIHTQMEDKAIEDLHQFYNVDTVFDEIVTINRVQIGLVALPIWVPTNKFTK